MNEPDNIIEQPAAKLACSSCGTQYADDEAPDTCTGDPTTSATHEPTALQATTVYCDQCGRQYVTPGDASPAGVCVGSAEGPHAPNALVAIGGRDSTTEHRIDSSQPGTETTTTETTTTAEQPPPA